MEERQQSLQDFKDGEFRCLICTDVASRGIDIQQLPFVINYTLPDTPELYGKKQRKSVFNLKTENSFSHACI
jgi:superfamily II DNA/RNA helicase